MGTSHLTKPIALFRCVKENRGKIKRKLLKGERGKECEMAL